MNICSFVLAVCWCL